MDETFEVIDESGRVLGTARRSELHSNPALLHRVVHVLVFDDDGRLLLQKRSLNKDIAPGRWDTSVGGHIEPGEEVLTAACREMREELGVMPSCLNFLYSNIYRNNVESELVYTYGCVHNGPFAFNTDEIDEVRFWKLGEIMSNLGAGIFSGHFESEIRHYLHWAQP